MSITISRKSPHTDKINTMELPLTQEEYETAYMRWRVGGYLIQDAFPTLNNEQREFIKTGYTPEDWKEMFGEDEE
jgi:hypothetical protein